MQINDNNFDELLASYIDGDVSNEQIAEIHQMMSHDIALFRDVTMATKTVCLIEIDAENEKIAQYSGGQWNNPSSKFGKANYANASYTKPTDFAEETHYTQQYQGILEKYPQIPLERYYAGSLKSSRWISFKPWIFILPLLIMYAMMIFGQMLKSIHLYNRYFFESILYIALIGSLVTIVIALIRHIKKMNTIAQTLENEIDYIEKNHKRLKRIIKGGKFGIYDAKKLRIIIPAHFDFIDKFERKRAQAIKGNQETYIDEVSGKEII